MRGCKIGFSVFGLCWLAMTLGCGSGDPLGRKAVQGTVMLDGAPLQDGAISFQPVEGGVTSAGAVITQGKYSIPRDKGLPLGKYRVVINAVKPGTGWTIPEGAMPGEAKEGSPPVELIPSEWNTESKNFVEVTATTAPEFAHEIVTKK